MSMQPKTMESELNSLSGNLETLPKNMRIFSLCLRSLYAEHQVSNNSDVAKRFNELRDATKGDALVYCNAILPVCTEVIRSLDSYLDYYTELDYEDWKDGLDDVIDEVTSYEKCCTEVVKLHETIMVPLKQREDEAKVMVEEFKELSTEYEKQKRELEKRKETKENWAKGLLLIPGVNVIASPILFSSAESDMVDAIAKKAQSKINQQAAFVVKDTLVPALQKFIDGLSATAGFFNIMKHELIKFKETATEDKKKIHFTLMNKRGKTIQTSCKHFYAMIPDVRTDLQAIPYDAKDQNYVDNWVKVRKEEIRSNNQSHLKGALGKILELMSAGNPALKCFKK